VTFAAGVTDLPEPARRDLDALAQRMSANPTLRLQLAAYASAAAGEENQARRISLSRALAVRAFLIEHGVASGRMDVRALGNHAVNGDPADRVDIVLLEH
jgi:outer membrane protein OmpA-like peptidoglycan-associated protein